MSENAKVLAMLAAILVIFPYPTGFAASEQSSALVFQRATFTVILEKAPLNKVFESVQKETGIWFRVAESELNETVSVRFENLSFKQGLKRILRTMNYSFLFDQDDKLVGVFVFGKANGKTKAARRVDLNEQMLKAVMAGDTASVISLVTRGADVNAKGAYSGWTPLILASRKGEIELLNFLLSQGADVDVKSSLRGRTALMEAVRYRKAEVVKALLTADPNIDAVDWEGYTVLMFAAVSGQLDVVDTLLHFGADVNVKNKVGSSALMMASGYPKVRQKLKEAGAAE